MKATLALGLLAAVSTSATAQHKIALYADAAHSVTEAFDNSPGMLTLYVVHEGFELDGTAAFFKIVGSPGFTGVWTGETTSFLFMGTSQTGLSLAYGEFCLPTPVPLVEIQYALSGTSDECSFLEVVAHPDVDIFGGPPVTMDCDLTERSAIGGRLIINPNPDCSSLPVHTSTWGRIKVLYH